MSLYKNRIIINEDIYYLNEPYYAYLRKKVLNDHSIMAVAFLLKDQLGDYPDDLMLLNKSWFPEAENLNYKIVKAIVKTHDMNSPDDFFERWNVAFNYAANNRISLIERVKIQADGTKESSLKKSLQYENLKYFLYKLDKYTSKASSTDLIYYNKKTRQDAVKREWLQIGLNRQTTSVTWQIQKKVYRINGFISNDADIKKIITCK